MPQEWGFYEVAVGIIALLFTAIGTGWALYERHKNRKDLRVSKSDSIPLVVVRPGVKNLRMLLGEMPVDDPYITTLEVRNSGRIPITPDDFVGPLSIQSDTHATVLSAVVSAADPENLNPSLGFTETEVTIQPLLMNGGDGFKVSILTEGAFTDPSIAGRIAGVRTIKEVNLEAVDRARQMRMVLLTAIISGAIIGGIVSLAVTAVLEQIIR
jgi:hypothetical protein